MATNAQGRIIWRGKLTKYYIHTKKNLITQINKYKQLTSWKNADKPNTASWLTYLLYPKLFRGVYKCLHKTKCNVTCHFIWRGSQKITNNSICYFFSLTKARISGWTVGEILSNTDIRKPNNKPRCNWLKCEGYRMTSSIKPVDNGMSYLKLVIYWKLKRKSKQLFQKEKYHSRLTIKQNLIIR